ncbi:MAG: DUF4395 domain-containing protein [Halobacteriota archaeon]
MTQTPATTTGHRAMVDPRAPRFGQGLTASLLVVGIALVEPMVVYLVAVVLVTSVLTGWRVDLYGLLWRYAARRLVTTPVDPEPAAPHRFAKLLGATGTTLATGLLLVDLPLLGFAIAGVIAVLAGLAAVSGLCLGCKMYRQVSTLRRLDIV